MSIRPDLIDAEREDGILRDGSQGLALFVLTPGGVSTLRRHDFGLAFPLVLMPSG
jgi:hypothetical protein